MRVLALLLALLVAACTPKAVHRPQGAPTAQKPVLPIPEDEDRPEEEGDREELERRAAARIPYNQGLALAESGDYPGAILEFRAAIERDEELAAAHYNLGLVYRRTGDLDRAEESLARAASLEPDRADYQSALGLDLYELGRRREAEKSFRRALDIDPKHLPSLYALARLLSEDGREEEARRFWRSYLQLSPGGPRAEEAREHLKERP